MSRSTQHKMDTIPSVFKVFLRRKVSPPQAPTLKLLGVGRELPTRIFQGGGIQTLEWKWWPQLLISKIVREEWNRRGIFRNANSSSFFKFSWKIWNAYLLVMHGYMPLAGAISGRRARLAIDNISSGQFPFFAPISEKLLIMRSAGRCGLILSDYSNFLEIKLLRNDGWSFITGAEILNSNIFTSRERSSTAPHHDLPDRMFQVNVATEDIQQELMRTRLFQNVKVRNGYSLINNASEVVYPRVTSASLPQTFPCWPHFLWASGKDGWVHAAPVIARTHKENGHFINVVDNLYHFIEEVLPQVALHNEICAGHDIFVGGNFDAVLHDLLKQTSNTPVHLLETSQEVAFDKLYVTEFADFRTDLMAGIPNLNAETIMYIKLALGELDTAKFESEPFGRRIYVARRKGLLRKLINKEKVYKVLRDRGFEIVYFEELDLHQRIELLKDTSILVGESGAGLANSYLMRDKALVIELRHPTMLNSLEHLTLSIAKDIDYRIIMGKLPNLLEVLRHGKDSFRIPTQDLAEILDRTNSHGI
jgi:hypothetical protein